MITNDYLINLTDQKYQSLQSAHAMTEFYNELKLLENNEYSDTHYKLKTVSIELERALFNNDAHTAKKLEKEKSDLTIKKAQLKNKLSKTENIVYECELCKDTSKTESDKLCHCYYNNLTKLALNLIGIKPHKLSAFCDDAISDSKSKTFLDKLKKYAESFNQNSKSLLFLGSTGTGKTFNAQAIASEVANKNYNVLFLTANEFNSTLLNFHLAPAHAKQLYADILTTSDLLIIDDIGTEPIYKNVTLEHFLFIISTRQSLNKPYIITTNLTEENLHQRYGERLLSRLTHSTVRITQTGKDKRIKI